MSDKTIVSSWNEWDPLKHVIVGEFSALVAAGYLSFEDGLQLVAKRARANTK